MKLTKTSLWFFIIIALFIPFCLWQNNSIQISDFTYCNAKIPADFNNFKIVHISDLHNKLFGHKQSQLLGHVKSLSPDIIVISGDLIDRRKFDLEKAMDFIDGAVSIAPVYYVSGNHEAWSGKYSRIVKRLLDAGVYVMDDTSLEVLKGDSSIQIMGLSDLGFAMLEREKGANTSKMKEVLSGFSDIDGFKILLSHRPEHLDLYAANDMDMIFSGHAHGGQIRIPFVGGLIAPGQGYFPKYTSGRYDSKSSAMYVSRGLGNSLFPLRIFNRPNIVAVTLKNTSD